MSTPTLTQLHQAVSIAEQIQKLEAELASILGGSTPSAPRPAPAAAKPAKTGKRTMSPDTIAKMRAAQQARWSKIKGTAAPAAVVKPPVAAPKKKGGLSAEGRAKIVAALKARWAAKKAASAPKAKAAPAAKATPKAKGAPWYAK